MKIGEPMNKDYCPACLGEGVIYWPIYSSPTFLEMIFGGFIPRQIGEKKDDGPCPMCNGTGFDPYANMG